MNYEVLRNIFQAIYLIAGLLTIADLFLWIGLRICKKYDRAKKAAIVVFISAIVCGIGLFAHVAVSMAMYNQ